MATPNRAGVLKQAHKVLKKHYKPVKPVVERSVLETILYACCLENAHHDKADDAFARLQELFFDWNEVRVTTVTELAEVMSGLPNPRGAAANLKRCLQNLFETHYSFDVDSLRKENIGKAEKRLAKYGSSHFVVSYVKQNALGGHAIPIDKGASDVLVIIGAITEAEAAKNQAPGLERAIPKAKGVEFGSLLHQLSADLTLSPHGQKVRKILLEIAPDGKDRLPKRASKASSKSKATKTTKSAAKPAGSKSAGTKKASKKASPKKAATKKSPAKKAKTATKKSSKKTTVAKSKKATAKKKTTKKTGKKPAKKAKASTKRLARKKPR